MLHLKNVVMPRVHGGYLFGECASSFASRGVCNNNMSIDQYVSDDSINSHNLPALSHILMILAE